MRQHQVPGRRPRGRYHHPGGQSRHRARARLQGSEAHGVLRPLPLGIRRLREPQGRAGKAPAQRRRLQLRARDLPGPGLWLPLRLPGPLAHGDHPGTSGTRIRGGPHRHGALGHLPGGHHRRQDAGDRQPGPPARLHQDQGPLRTLCEHGHPRAQRIRGQRHEALRGQARHPEEPALPGRQPRGGDLRAALCRDRL